MIGIAMPAHNEERLLQACLAVTRIASQHPVLAGESARTIVVLDDCNDAAQCSGCLQRSDGCNGPCAQRGLALHVGADVLPAKRGAAASFTDAGTVVSDPWLAA